jgi:hypothetical protein
MKFYYRVSESLEYGYATEVGLSEKCSHVSLSHTHTSGVEISRLFYSFIPGMEHRVPRGYKTKLKLFWRWVVDLASYIYKAHGSVTLILEIGETEAIFCPCSIDTLLSSHLRDRMMETF